MGLIAGRTLCRLWRNDGKNQRHQHPRRDDGRRLPGGVHEKVLIIIFQRHLLRQASAHRKGMDVRPPVYSSKITPRLRGLRPVDLATSQDVSLSTWAVNGVYRGFVSICPDNEYRGVAKARPHAQI